MIYLLFLLGLFVLIKGADYFVDGAGELTELIGLSPLFIGLSVAALGTSAPEAAVSIKAAITDHSSISFGNIFGSNIANIGLCLGVGALILGIKGRISTIRKEIPFSLAITFILVLLLRNDWYSNSIIGLSRIDGVVLIVLFSLYLFYLYRMAKSDRRSYLIEAKDEEIEFSRGELLKSIAFVVFGIGGVIFGANLVVDNAVKIAARWGVSETLISVSIIALGTSLPEVATSVSAVKKGKPDIALGNVVGSNIFNILFVLGITSLTSPLVFPAIAFNDLLIVAGITLILFVFIWTENEISRKEGFLLLLLYVLYIVFAIIRR